MLFCSNVHFRLFRQHWLSTSCVSCSYGADVTCRSHAKRGRSGSTRNPGNIEIVNTTRSMGQHGCFAKGGSKVISVFLAVVALTKLANRLTAAAVVQEADIVSLCVESTLSDTPSVS